MTHDIVYRNARVHDGMRFLPFGAEVGIDGNFLRISLSHGTLPGNKVIDASGLILSPPFMDTHNHGDLRLLTRNGINLLAQGCGTVLIGQCGFSPWGECGNHPIFLEDSDIPAFKNAKEFFGALASTRPTLEIRSFVGLHALMPLEGAEDRLREAMDAGCIGLSVGLNYTGQLHTSTSDIVRLAKVLREYGNSRWAGIAWHMRDGGNGFEASVREIIEVYQRSDVPCHINHFKRYGLADPNAVPRVLSTLEKYPAITAEMYPYDISWTTLEYLVSEGASRVGDGASLECKAAAGCGVCCPAGGWSDVVPVSGMPAEWHGHSVADIAKELAFPPERVCADIMRRAPSATACYQHACLPSDYEHVLRWRRGFVGGDGHAYSKGEGGHHPRSFGAVAKSFRLLVDRGWLTEEEAIAKLTGEPRRVFKIDGGRIADGHAANLCLWNPSVFRDQATLASPNALALGISAVFYEGCPVYHASAPHDHFQIAPLGMKFL
jgi:N-acyl-D-amino-acid deacylase